MEIEDSDILAAKEIVINMEINNVTYIELRCDERLIKRIRMVDKEKAFDLAQQLHEYKHELHEEKLCQKNVESD